MGLVVKKSRWRKGTNDNHGEFMLTDPMRNIIVAGPRFNMTAEEVVEFCENETNRPFPIASV